MLIQFLFANRLLEFEDGTTLKEENKQTTETVADTNDIDDLLGLEAQTNDELLSGIFSPSNLMPSSSSSGSSPPSSNNFFLPSQLLSLESKNINSLQHSENSNCFINIVYFLRNLFPILILTVHFQQSPHPYLRS